jgi:NitT/TauT family transport system substrate-binding protein
MVDILNEPSTKYTVKPENVMKYANFMADIKSIKNRPAALTDLFFPGPAVSSGN